MVFVLSFAPVVPSLLAAPAPAKRPRQATEGERKGAVMFGDEMIDEASRKVAVKVVTRGERAGRTRSAKT